MKTVIRPDPKKFFLAQQGNALFLLVFLFLAIYKDLPQLWLSFWFLFVLLGAMFLISLFNFRKSHIEISDQFISGWISRGAFKLLLVDILVVKEVIFHGYKYLFVATNNESMYIPEKSFNFGKINSNLKEKVSPLAFEEKSYDTFQGNIKNKLLSDTIVAGTNMFSSLPLWLGVVLGFFFLWMRFWVSKANDLFFLAACFSIPSLVLIFLCYSRIKADADSIKLITRNGQFKFSWDELINVQISQTGNTVVLHGENKQLIVDLSLAGKNRGDLSRKILAHIEDRNIVPINKPIYFPIFNKNTRLPKGESF